MCDTAYHQEARRKARVLQRQQEYLKSASAQGQISQSFSTIQTRPNPVSADPNKHYVPMHDPSFSHRLAVGDRIYKMMYPGNMQARRTVTLPLPTGNLCQTSYPASLYTNQRRERRLNKYFFGRSFLASKVDCLCPNLKYGDVSFTQSSLKNIGPSLSKFRVNDEGFSNRYRNRAHLAPHTDTLYPVIYPGSSNEDYTRDTNQVNRRMNKHISDYEIRRKVNGDFDMKVLVDSLPVSQLD